MYKCITKLCLVKLEKNFQKIQTTLYTLCTMCANIIHVYYNSLDRMSYLDLFLYKTEIYAIICK